MRQVVTRIFAIGIAIAAAAASSSSFAQLTYNPVATTGYDADVIFEAGLAEGAAGANDEIGSRQFYELGISGAVPDRGLPRTITGVVSTISGNIFNMGLAPFEASNTLKFDADQMQTDVKSLSLTTPAKFSNIAIAFSGGSLGGGGLPQNGFIYQLEYKVNFASGSPQTGIIIPADWNANAGAGSEELFNADRTNNNFTTFTATGFAAGTASATRWSIYVQEIPITNTGANITSIDFRTFMTDGTTTVNLSAITGTEAATAAAGRDVHVFGVAGVTPGGGGGFNAADFDHQNGVGPADLGIWRTNFGLAAAATNAQGDADADLDVDGADYLVWQKNFGATSAVGSVASIPEPASAILALLGLTAAAQVRRRRN